MSPVHEKSPYTSETRRYVRSGSPEGQPLQDIHKRSEGFIRTLAANCRGCIRKGSADCYHRCACSGAAALVRDYDQLGHPCELAKETEKPSSCGRKQGSTFGETMETRRRRLALWTALQAFGDIGAMSVELQSPGSFSAEKGGDLVYLLHHGAVERVGEGVPHRYRALKLKDTTTP